MNSSPAEEDLEVTGDGRLNISRQCGLIVNKADYVLCHIKIMASRLREVGSFLCLILSMNPICVQVWVPKFKRAMEKLDRAQQRTAKMVWDPEHVWGAGLWWSSEEVIWSNISLQLYKWQLKADGPHSSLQKLVIKKPVMDLSCSLGGSRWILEKDMFTRRVVQHWNRLFIEQLESLILEVFKTSLHKTVADLIWHSHSLVSSRRLE